MANINHISLNGHPIPVIAFFGTRGGVGKSTISQYMAELTISADGLDRRPPNVLLIDMDVNHRQLTRHYTEKHATSACPTLHELVRLEDANKVDALNVTSLIEEQKDKKKARGELFFVPSAKREHVDVYSVGAKTDPQKLRQLLSDIIQELVTRHKISCVILDCTAGADNYTAVAATIADVPLCVSLVEPQAFDRIDEQAEKIKHICPDFSISNLKSVLNRYSRKDKIEQLEKIRDVFHSIPFTNELLFIEEGFENIDELRLAIFKDYIVQLSEKLFRYRWPELIPSPSITVPAELAVLAHVAPHLHQSKGIKRLRLLQYLKHTGIFIVILSILCLIFVSKARPSDKIDAADPLSSKVEKNELYVIGGQPIDRKDLSNVSIVGLLLGIGFISVGTWASRRLRELLETIGFLNTEGVIWIMKQLEDKDGRKHDRIKRLYRLAMGLPETREYLRSVRL